MLRRAHIFGGMALLLLFIAAPNCRALLTRTFVSAVRGSDNNPCTPASPCRTFAVAMAATTIGGEVIAMDSGGYGPFTVTQSVQIEAAPGVFAGLTAVSGDGIVVNAGSHDVVVLRGLSIRGIGAANHNGITFNSGQKLFVENCLIEGFANDGIDFLATYTSPDAGILSVKDSIVRNNGVDGIFVKADGSGSATVSIEHSHFEKNFDGVVNRSAVTTVLVRDTVISGPSVGIGSDGGADITVENCTVHSASTGLVAQNAAIIRVSNSTITDNNQGIFSGAAGAIISFGNNRLTGNTNDGIFDSTIPPQ